jgi:hypothetical protein
MYGPGLSSPWPYLYGRACPISYIYMLYVMRDADSDGIGAAAVICHVSIAAQLIDAAYAHARNRTPVPRWSYKL